MKKRAKKRLQWGKALVGTLCVLFLVNGILILSGWYQTVVPLSETNVCSMVRGEENLSDMSIMDAAKASNVLDYCMCFEGMHLSYDVNVSLEAGAIELAMVEVPEEIAFVLDGLELNKVRTYEVTSDSSFVWDLSDLPSGKRYALLVTGSADSIFMATIKSSYQVYRWQRFYERLCRSCTFLKDTCSPNYIPFFQEWW